VTDVPVHAVRWVLLAGGLWYPVVASSFDLQLAREWGGRDAFGYGFSFLTGDYRIYGPVTRSRSREETPGRI
jgi:hypothetical protein